VTRRTVAVWPPSATIDVFSRSLTKTISSHDAQRLRLPLRSSVEWHFWEEHQPVSNQCLLTFPLRVTAQFLELDSSRQTCSDVLDAIFW